MHRLADDTTFPVSEASNSVMGEIVPDFGHVANDVSRTAKKRLVSASVYDTIANLLTDAAPPSISKQRETCNEGSKATTTSGAFHRCMCMMSGYQVNVPTVGQLSG